MTGPVRKPFEPRPAKRPPASEWWPRMLRMTTAIPADHPAHIIGTPDESDAHARLEVHVSGGHRPFDAPSLMHWHADISVTRWSDDSWSMPVATMNLTAVNPYLGDPFRDLDSRDQDSYELAEALWTYGTGERTDDFLDIAPDDGGHVLLVDTYEMQPAWRGTPLTPLIALRVLDVFGHLGFNAAALTAAPMSTDLDLAERDRVATRIATMWERVGFSHLTDDGKVMAMSFDCESVQQQMREIAGDDPVLREAIDL